MTLINPDSADAQNRAKLAEPDFRFPEKVITGADATIKQAERSGNAELLISGVMQRAKAMTSINPDSINAVVDMVGGYIDAATDPVAKAMLQLLQASYFNSYYQANRYKLDQRTVPADELAADVREWSGNQIGDTIAGLLEDVLAQAHLLKAVKITTFSKVIEQNNLTAIYYPSLFDFATHIASYVLTSRTSSNVIMPVDALTFTVPAATLDMLRLNRYDRLLLNFENKNVDLAPEGSASRITALTNRFSTVVKIGSFTAEQQSDALFSLYEQNSESEFSGSILMKYVYFNINSESVPAERLVDLMAQNIKQYPGNPMRASLESFIMTLTTKKVSLDYPNMVIPGVPFKFTVKTNNVYNGDIVIFRVPAENYYNQKKTTVDLAKPYKVIKASATETKMVDNEFTAEGTIDEPGYYVAAFRVDGISDKELGSRLAQQSLHPMAVCQYGISRLYDNNGNDYLTVINLADGSPAPGATIVGLKNWYRGYEITSSTLGKTDSFGLLKIKSRNTYNDNAYYAIVDGTATGVVRPGSYYGSRDRNETPERVIQSQIIFSRPLYRPGDDVEWTAFLYVRNTDNTFEPLARAEVEATFYNANNVEVAKTTLTADEYGRVQGKFPTSADDLTGTYRVTVRTESLNPMSDLHRPMFSGWVTVSDYKLPTFFVDKYQAANGVPTAGDVTLSGRAMTFSGFPLADVDIEITIDYNRLSWFFRGNTERFDVLKATTDADGNFNLVVPAALLGMKDFKQGFFTAALAATSSSGETVRAMTTFSIGYKYNLIVNSDLVADASKPVEVPLKVVGIDGVETPSLIDYTLLDGDRVVLSDQFNAPFPTLDLSAIPSGCYTLRMAMLDSTLAAPAETRLTLYRTTDTASPVKDTPVWFIDKYLTVNPGEDATFAFEASRSGLCLNVAILANSAKAPVITRHITTAGYNTLTIPAVDEETVIAVWGSDMAVLYDKNLSINVIKKRENIKIVSETFRDRLVPSTAETWRFKIVDTETGNGVPGAAMATMFNQAIEQIESYRWFTAPSIYYPSGASINYRGFSSSILFYYWFSQKGIEVPHLELPTFKYPLDFFGRVMMYSKKADPSRSVGAINYDAGDTNIVREHRSEVIVEESAMAEDADLSALQGRVAGVTNMAMSDAIEADIETGAGSATASEPTFTYRDREVAQAFFMPMLTSDAKGNVTMQFDVPNANSSWTLNLFAFTSKVLTATFNATVVTSRPVMVQPNLPRFLRQGDVATVKALVMNNSDSTDVAVTVIETFDPVTGAILSTDTFEDTIAAGASTTVQTTLTTPDGASLIGYRVKSTLGGHTDGEQTLLPILESVQPVVESRRFFMAPDVKNYTTEVSPTAEGEWTSLTFCENPAWEVISALPGLQADKPSTTLDAVYTLCSAATARGLMKDNPEVARELQRWLASDRSDSTLISALERNADLKIMMLNATPWVQAAESDTERMTRLALLFDNKAVNATIDSSIAALAKFNTGAGWKWSEWGNYPSLWITTETLYVLGRLVELGYLPSNKRLASMIKDAVDYTDREASEEFKDNPKRDLSVWACMRIYFPDVKMSTATSTAYNAQVQRAVANWGNEHIEGKAWDALLLNANGYRETAREIAESLRQHAVSTPEKGMWWPSLDVQNPWRRLRTTGLVLRVFAATGAPMDEINAVRQWLIGEKQTQNWGSAATTTDLIADILLTSRDYFNQAGTVSVALNGDLVDLPKFDSALGMFRLNLGKMLPAGGRLDIARSGDTPSWGAVMTMRQAAMDSIPAVATEGLSIEKKIYLLEQSAAGVVARDAGTFKVGDLVRVELIINVDRDLDYVTIDDRRAACLEPVEQLPTPLWQDGTCFYRENRDASTRLFIDRLRHGVYRLHYDMRVNNAGTFASGIATVQSQYAPDATAHSSGTRLPVLP
ncbi:MAG: hypothetical protein J1E63_07190 [Muribaculaceae bacterium]|nr:hypothetical protein [Muribaculaceae bacterium]